MTAGTMLFRLSLIAALALPAPALAYHAGDMIVGSTVAGGGALAVRFDFTQKVQVSPSFVGPTQTLYSGTDPGWDQVFPSEPPLYAVVNGTVVRVEITAIDAPVSLKVGAVTLAAVGDAVTLGTSDGMGNGSHVHPEWRLLLSNGVTGEYHVSYRLVATGPYAQSATYTATITNVPPAPPTTTSTSTSSSTSISTSSTTSTSTTSSTTSTSGPGATTSSTSTTSTTLAPSADLLDGRLLTLKSKPGDPNKQKLSMRAKDVDVTLGGGYGSTDDPTLHGGSVRVASTIGGFDDTYPLPIGSWKVVGKPSAVKGWRYGDKALAAGPIKTVVVTAGKGVKVVGKGASLGHTLGVDPAPVTVTITLGTHRYCLTFGGTTKWKADTSFTAKDSAPPGTCVP